MCVCGCVCVFTQCTRHGVHPRLLLVSAVQCATSGDLDPTLATAERYGICSPQMAFMLTARKVHTCIS